MVRSAEGASRTTAAVPHPAFVSRTNSLTRSSAGAEAPIAEILAHYRPVATRFEGLLGAYHAALATGSKSWFSSTCQDMIDSRARERAGP